MSLASDGLRPKFGEEREDDEMLEGMGEGLRPLPDVATDAAGAVADGAAVDDTNVAAVAVDVDDTNDGAFLMGNFRLLILDKGLLKREST